MKDRQPTQVLANGAIRYGVYNADGTLDHYEYLKREDAPTVEGTPLNKANLLSDATAAKLWPNASTRPEDPTVNDALGKLSEGTAKVGDIAITSRTDLSDAWLPCDGRTVSQEQYPSLCAVLRTPDNPAIWTEKIVSTNVGAGGDALSYENGHWFRTYRDATSAHILVSDNGETWTEWPLPQNFWTDSTTLTSRIVAANAVKHYNNQYVCSVLVLCATTSGTEYHWGVLFAREVFNAFQIDSPGVVAWYDSDRVEDFTGTRADIYWDGRYFFIVGIEIGAYANSALFRYTDQLTAKTRPATSSETSWTAGSHLPGRALQKILVLAAGDGILVVTIRPSDSNVDNSYEWLSYFQGVTASRRDKDLTTLKPSDSIEYGAFFEVNNDVYLYYTFNSSEYYRRKITVGSTLDVSTSRITEGDRIQYAISCSNQVVGVYDSTVKVAENIEQGWDFSASLPKAIGNYPVAVGTIVRLPYKSQGTIVQDGVHDFAYDNKKIPNITTDSRSGAYIKALEE